MWDTSGKNHFNVWPIAALACQSEGKGAGFLCASAREEPSARGAQIATDEAP